MKNNFILAACGAAAIFALPVSAVSAGDKGVKADANSEKADDPATVVCKRLAPPVGTRMPGKKVCKTNAAWDAEKAAAEAAARENQERSGTGNTRRSG